MLSEVVLATTTLPHDDDIEKIAHQCGVNVYRGSESNVLSRFAEAANLYGAEIVVRVCGDNPFIDHEEIDRLINFYINNPCDYAFNHQNRLNSGYADGFGAEVLNNNLLNELNDTVLVADELEHVTLNIWNNQDCFEILPVPVPEELNYPDLRFDVDIIDDFNYLISLLDKGVKIDSTAEEIINIAMEQ